MDAELDSVGRTLRCKSTPSSTFLEGVLRACTVSHATNFSPAPFKPLHPPVTALLLLLSTIDSDYWRMQLLQLNMYSVVLGASSLALVVTYPLMKRVTAWPQAFLGLVFNWGALLGWAAVQGQCDWSVVLPLYAAGWGWTMVYDTVYAHQDRADDIVVGIKSTAVRFGGKTKAWLAAFGALSTAGLLLAGVNAEQGLPYFLGVGGAVAHGARCVYLTRLGVAEDCWRCFNQMKWGGAVVFGGAWASTLLP